MQKEKSVFEELNIPLSIVNRLSNQKTNKNIVDLNRIINQVDLIDIYRILHQKDCFLELTWYMLHKNVLLNIP